MPVNTFVLLRTEGVTAVIDLTDGRLPSIPYWGADLGELSESEVAAIARSSEFPTAANIVDDPVRSPCSPSTGPAGWAARPERLTRRPGLVAEVLHHRAPGRWRRPVIGRRPG